MKRGGFLKRTPLAKKSKKPKAKVEPYNEYKGYHFRGTKRVKPTLSVVQKDLWENYVTIRIKERDGYVCCSCGTTCTGSNRHGGHFELVVTGGALLRYHPHNIHVQCARCNANEGNRTEYFPFMEKKYGREYVDKLLSLKNKNIQGDTLFYEKVRKFYEANDLIGCANWLDNYN